MYAFQYFGEDRSNLIKFNYLSKDIKAIDKVRMLGDNLVAETFRKNFKKANDEFFLKKHYDIVPFCSSRFNDKNTNMLSRLQHLFASALNSKTYLQAYIVVFLEDDLIEYLNYSKFKVALQLGTWVEFLAKELFDMLSKHQQQLPDRATLKENAQIYLIETISHKISVLTRIKSETLLWPVLNQS